MIRRTLIVALTILSLWTIYCWGGSHAPKASSFWFKFGSQELGWTANWHVYQGNSYLKTNKYGEMGRSGYSHSYRPPPIWIFLLILAIYPCIAFINGPFRRCLRRGRGLCVSCGNTINTTLNVCSQCGCDAGCVLKMTGSRWFALTVLQATVMMLMATICVADFMYDEAIIFAILGLASPLFGLVWGIIYTKIYNYRRPKFGRCSKCNYNLTGNTTGVCSECGTEISAEMF